MGENEKEPGASEGVKASTMQAAIMAMMVVNVPMLLATFGMGYTVHYGVLDFTLGTHVKVGLITSFLTVLTHTTTMFYFMGTGSAIKAEVRDRNLDTEFLRRARAFCTWYPHKMAVWQNRCKGKQSRFQLSAM